MSLRFTAADATEWRQNWTVAMAAAFGLALMNMPMHSIGIFMNPLETEFGWSRSTIASGAMFIAVASVVLAPIVGSAVDRLGPRRIAMVGATGVCLVFGMFSLVNGDRWSWWGLWAVLACAFVLIMPMVWTAAISSLFRSSRGLALAVALSGTAVTSAVLPLMSTLLIQNYGWRMAYVGVAAVFAIVVLPIVFLFFTSAVDRTRSRTREQAEDRPILAGHPAREALKSSRFLRLLLAASAMNAVPTVTSSLIPIMTSLDHSQIAAATVASIVGVAGLVGRISGGYLLDRVNGNVVAGCCMILPIVGVLVMLSFPHSLVAFLVAGAIMGLCVGAELDAVAFLTTRHFGLRSFGLLLAIISSIQTLIYAAGPVALNHVYDLTGSYHWGLIAVIPVCALTSILFFTLGPYRYPDERVSASIQDEETSRS